VNAIDPEGEEVVFVAEIRGAEIVQYAQERADLLEILPRGRGDRRNAAEAGAVVGDAAPALRTGRRERRDVCRRVDPFRLEAGTDVAVELEELVVVAADLPADQRVRRLGAIKGSGVGVLGSRLVETP